MLIRLKPWGKVALTAAVESARVPARVAGSTMFPVDSDQIFKSTTVPTGMFWAATVMEISPSSLITRSAGLNPWCPGEVDES